MLLYSRTMPRQDHQRLTEEAKLAAQSSLTHAPYLDWFRADLRRARVVPQGDVPPDVITMNSRFSLKDLRREETRVYTLVYPEDESPDRGKLCVLSPMGMALLGARVGDVLFLYGAGDPQTVKVLDLLYQPESAGDHHL
jgi:regulator of nucleoside diphosphate kinase